MELYMIQRRILGLEYNYQNVESLVATIPIVRAKFFNCEYNYHNILK